MHLWKSIHLHLFFVFGVLSSKMLFPPKCCTCQCERGIFRGHSVVDFHHHFKCNLFVYITSRLLS